MSYRYLLVLCIVFIFIPSFTHGEMKEAGKQDLRTVTMPSDIATSSYYELRTWAERLGLGTSGTKKDLQQELYAYYKIQPAQQTTSENTDTIVIKSAHRLKNIKIEEMDEQYIVLSGGVHLEMSDKKNNTLHEIYADKITFNETEKTVTAEGSITYIIVHDKTKEYFYGNSLTFNVETWKGMFFKGISEKKKKIDDKEVTFYFTGKEIYRKEGDKVVLVDGSISSSRGKNPYYHLKAQKIWVLDPGEWAILDPVLFVGRIPVFAFPFLFMPGDKLVFHPVYGMDDKEGYFINTTTYLVGQKKESSGSSLSFLQSSSPEGDTRLKREGLFLRRTSIPLPPQHSLLKVLADYYTRKGFFLGLDGTATDSGMIQSFSFLAGIGFNRYIYNDPLYGYSPYLFDSTSGSYVSQWEHPYFLGTKIPFRFVVDTELTGKVRNAKIVLNLPLYSDPSFPQDFLNRKESFDFKSLFKSGGADITAPVPPSNALLWNFSLQWNVNTDTVKPYIQNISINTLAFKVSFLSKEYQYDTVPLDPLRFYYPMTISYPDFSGSINGTLFTFGSEGSTKSIKPADSGMDPPWHEEKQENPSPEKGFGMTPPAVIKDVPLPADYRYSGVKGAFSYSLFPRLTARSILNTQVPAIPEDTKTVPDYSTVTFQNDASLMYDFSISDKLLDIRSKLTFKTNYKNHFSKSSTYNGDWNLLLDQDTQNTNYSIVNGTVLKSYPLLWAKDFSTSYISYAINTILFNHTYNQTDQRYDDTDPGWNTDVITHHQAAVSAVYQTEGSMHALEIKMVLPPYAPELYPALKNSWGPFSSVISTGIKKNADTLQWKEDPVSILGTYSFGPAGYVSETFSYDYSNLDSFSTTDISLKSTNIPLNVKELFKYDVSKNEPVLSTTAFGIGFFTSSFTAETVDGYTFQPLSGWIATEDPHFQPSKVSFGIQSKYSPDPFWKNRIRFSSDITSSLSMNLLKPTDTAFTFNLSWTLFIAEFLDVTFSSRSVNRAFYRYIPEFSTALGLAETINPLLDLVKSFNFFNKSDRIASNFNLDSLELAAVHHLGDWDLNVEYSGKPEIVTTADLRKEYQWSSSLSIYLSWKPIPEIKKEVSVVKDEITF